ncbi:hypothetical protein (inferred from BLASTP similarity), partial [Trypanosoma grayi]|uniref:hypothetical protein (inferred from BLASTP similarity) n=1 Tax=Trypanosoma grayi TaxID=71804 RepID=UPI0004F488CD
ACAAGDRELVELLLESGDAIGQVSHDGRYTLIHYAAAHPTVLDALLERGLSIDAENALGESALVSLICYAQGINAEFAIREAPRPSDAPRLAALPQAAMRNYILTPLQPLVASTAKPLKSSSATTGSSAVEGDYPAFAPDADAWWYFATGSNAWIMIQNLCERGADVDGNALRGELRKVVRRTLDNKNCMSPTPPPPLRYGSSGSSPWLSDEQSDSLSGGDAVAGSGRSPLGHASGEDQFFFHRHGTGDGGRGSGNTDCRPSMRYVTRLTPLMHAIVAYHPELIRRLAVDYRADPMVQDAHGACALHYAALARHPSVMELMLSSYVAPTHAHFDINAQDCRGRTPLHYAAAHGNAGVVRVLLAAGPMLHASTTDYAGRTPLHLAVLASETAAVELLLHHTDATAGADTMSTVSA